MSEEINPKLDEFTSKVVGDPAKPQDTLLLQGFLGASSQPDHTRVYSDISLDNYVDVANADIIHIEPLSKDQSPMGGSFLWIKTDAEVTPGTGTGDAAAAKAKFLQGPIASEATAPAVGLAQTTAIAKTAVLVACHPSILVRACPAPTPFPRCFFPTPVCPTRPWICGIVASGTGPCHIPDPTIQEQTPQFVGAQAGVAGAAGAAAFGVAAPHAHAGPAPDLGHAPSVGCPTWVCSPPTATHPQCVFFTPNCPQQPQTIAPPCHVTVAASVCQICPTTPALCHPTAPPVCHPTQAVSVCHICPTTPVVCHPSAPPVCHPTVAASVCTICPTHPPICPEPTLAISVCHVCPTLPPGCHLTVGGPECPVQTPLCPQHQASIACGEQQGPGAAQFAVGFAAPEAQLQAQPQLAPSVTHPACPVSVVAAGCPPPTLECPTRLCPTPLHKCPPPTPQCPTPLHHCPTQACPTPLHHCPSVNHFHCPSVNHWDCPPKTTIAADCPPTPQIQHCPTPNMICPRPTTLPCPSVTEICQTSSPIFC